jgi:DNA-binding NtrC family response regulator
MAATTLPAWHSWRTTPVEQIAFLYCNCFSLNHLHSTFIPWHCPCEGDSSMMKNIRNKSVLIVDDDARMLRALDKVLTNEGAAVTCAEWAGDAIDILTGRRKRIDLVITDLRMPFVSGLTAVYAIHKVLPKLPIIVLTAFGSPDVKAECLRQGAAAFLEKPLDTPQLLDVVEEVFASRKADAETRKPGKERGEELINENIEPRETS